MGSVETRLLGAFCTLGPFCTSSGDQSKNDHSQTSGPEQKTHSLPSLINCRTNVSTSACTAEYRSLPWCRGMGSVETGPLFGFCALGFSLPLQGIRTKMATAKPLAQSGKFSLPSLINSAGHSLHLCLCCWKLQLSEVHAHSYSQKCFQGPVSISALCIFKPWSGSGLQHTPEAPESGLVLP